VTDQTTNERTDTVTQKIITIPEATAFPAAQFQGLPARIATAQQADQVGLFKQAAKAEIKKIDEIKYKAARSAINDARLAVAAQCKAEMKPYEDIIALCDPLLRQWDDDELARFAREKKEADDAAEKERQRLQDEADYDAAYDGAYIEDAARTEAEVQRQALLKAAEEMKESDPEGAEAARALAGQVEEAVQEVILAAPVVAAPVLVPARYVAPIAKVAGSNTREVWKAVVVDRMAFLRAAVNGPNTAFVLVDQAGLDRQAAKVKTQGAQFLPGVEARMERVPVTAAVR
jgi:hypothetical protein